MIAGDHTAIQMHFTGVRPVNHVFQADRTRGMMFGALS
jgi:hypothetical protein